MRRRIPREIIQSQMGKISRLYFPEIPKTVRLTETESEMIDSRGWREGGMKTSYLVRTESLGKWQSSGEGWW